MNVAASPKPAGRILWPELDLLRGLAGLMMVVNHASVGLVAASAAVLVAMPADPWAMSPLQLASFVGSYAPAVFFFITGVGYGLQARPGGAGRKPGLWAKAGVLFLADALLWRSHGFWIGLDFFGFIGGSMLVLGLLIRLDRRLAVAAAAGGLLLVTAVRFAAVPVAARLLGPEAGLALEPWVGDRGVAGLSFPPFPWAGYPLVGLLVGAAASAWPAAVDRRRVRVATTLLPLAAVGFVAVAVLVHLGYPLTRWSRLSPSAYGWGFTLLALLVAACLLVFPARGGGNAESADRGPRWPFSPAVRGLSLRGVAAFAVVPLHFLLIAAAGLAGWSFSTAAGVSFACVVVSVLALAAAPAVSAAGERVRRRGGTARLWWAGLFFAVAMLVLVGLPAFGVHARSALASLGQLALCLLLALPLPWIDSRRVSPAHAAAASTR